MSRVAHTYPVECAAEGCFMHLSKGVLMCASCWSRVSPETQREVLDALFGWMCGLSVHQYIIARKLAIAEAGHA